MYIRFRSHPQYRIRIRLDHSRRWNVQGSMAKLRREDPLLALVRDPLLARVDRRLAAILAGSLIVHLGLAIVAWTTDIEEPERAPVAGIPVELDQVDIM